MAVVDPFVDAAALPATSAPLLPLEEVLQHPLVDAFLIAAPTSEHAQLVRSAIHQGKHVLCEKPLTLDPVADVTLERLATNRGRLLQIGFWRRFAEPYTQLREVLQASAIGRATAMRAGQWDAKAPPPAFCDPRVSGGLEIDCGVHEFDLARWLLGAEVDAVAAWSPSASPALAAVGDVETVYGVARLSGDRALTIDLTRTAGHRDSIRTEVIGEHGSVVVEFADTGRMVVRSGNRRIVDDLPARDVVAEALKAQLRVFAAGVRAGRLHRDASSAIDSRRALVAAQALRDARLAGSWLPVPP